MLKRESDIIRNNLSTLVEKTDVSRIIPILRSKHVLSQETIHRILNPAHDAKVQTAHLYRTLMKRGPQAYANLIDALQESNHLDLVELLNRTDSQGTTQVKRRSSLNSLESGESPESGDSDVERMNVYGGQGSSPVLLLKNSSERDSNVGDLSMDSRRSNNTIVQASPSLGQSKKNNGAEPCKFSDYFMPYSHLMNSSNTCKDDLINIRAERQLPVNVVPAKSWKSGSLHYKMNSYPRGCALIINNIEFEDSDSFPYRSGAENDQKRLKEMLEQLYFTVEEHKNKTRMEMDKIVRDFSNKEELEKVDCAVIVFMSHGAEGASEEDTEIIGVDGIGYKTKEIVDRFANKNCKALIHKPKIFIFQACRGALKDEGVYISDISLPHDPRTEFDGRKIEGRTSGYRIRSTSDVFIAYAVPPGRPANRDIYNGTWFIQAIIDVFSQYACKHDLEDMLKMVDNKIKNVDNLVTKNFQAVATTTIGWSKKLYFNPGLKLTDSSGAASLGGTGVHHDCEGMDVVDNCHGGARQQEQQWPKDEDDGEDGGRDCSRRGCLSVQKCTVI